MKNLTLPTSEKISLVGNLATMLAAGIPILEVVDSLLEDARGDQKKILDELRQDLIQGKRIHTTFEKFPRVFNKVVTNVIKASEEAGTLDITLKDLRESIRREAEFTDKVKSALIYPGFISVVFGVVLLLILILVIPRISQVFERLTVELPLPTRILIFVSNLLIKQGAWVLLGLTIFTLISIFIYRTNRKAILNILFSLPVISTIIYKIDLTRFARSFHLLLFSGLPIIRALELSEDVVIKSQTAKIIATSREMILSGKTLTAGFRASKGKVPTIMIKLIEAGEKTGTLEKSMQEISEYFDYEVSSTLKTVTALVEPVMLVAVGIIVGGMMMSIIAPIYGVISQVGGR